MYMRWNFQIKKGISQQEISGVGSGNISSSQKLFGIHVSDILKPFIWKMNNSPNYGFFTRLQLLFDIYHKFQIIIHFSST